MGAEDDDAILLLCSTLALSHPSTAPKALSRTEWNEVARAISTSRFRRPGGLLGASEEELRRELHLPPSLASRMVSLLGRGAQLAIERERLHSLGIWSVTRADSRYPARLKERLKGQAPPVLFGTGSVDALREMGLAVVGSRNIDDSGASFARLLGERCAIEGLAVFSGGARGVDQIAVKAALDRGGVAVAVLAESLEDVLKRRDMRLAVLDSPLTLVTALHPSTPFTVAAAMGRNKLIYSLASWAAVVSSGLETGGTWAGAIENLRAGWVPLLVRSDDDAADGNRELINRGAIPFQTANVKEGFRQWLDGTTASGPTSREKSSIAREAHQAFEMHSSKASAAPESGDLFLHVWPRLADFLFIPRTHSEVARNFALEPGQVKKWLERAVKTGLAEKLQRPIRFQSIASRKASPKNLLDT